MPPSLAQQCESRQAHQQERLSGRIASNACSVAGEEGWIRGGRLGWTAAGMCLVAIVKVWGRPSATDRGHHQHGAAHGPGETGAPKCQRASAKGQGACELIESSRSFRLAASTPSSPSAPFLLHRHTRSSTRSCSVLAACQTSGFFCSATVRLSPPTPASQLP